MGQTTISVSDDTLARFKRLKADATLEGLPEQSSDFFVQSLLDEWEREEDDQNELTEAVASDVTDALADAGVSLTYDDVVQACRKALRDELPEGAMR